MSAGNRGINVRLETFPSCCMIAGKGSEARPAKLIRNAFGEVERAHQGLGNGIEDEFHKVRRKNFRPKTPNRETTQHRKLTDLGYAREN